METTLPLDPELATEPPVPGASPVVPTERRSEPEDRGHQPTQEELEDDPLQLMPRVQRSQQPSAQKDHQVHASMQAEQPQQPQQPHHRTSDVGHADAERKTAPESSVPVAKPPPPPPPAPQLCKEETDAGVEKVVARTSAKAATAAAAASVGGVGGAKAASDGHKASVTADAETPQLGQPTKQAVSAEAPGRPAKSDNKQMKAASANAAGMPIVPSCTNLKAKAAPADASGRPCVPNNATVQASPAEAPGRPANVESS